MATNGSTSHFHPSIADTTGMVMNSPDVIDQATGLAPDNPLFGLRRIRAKVLHASQASHDALLFQAVAGLSAADRLRVAVHVCETSGATSLAQHYQVLLQALPAEQQVDSPGLVVLLCFADALTVDPRHGNRSAIAGLKSVGLDDAAIVALAQLVAFLSYQTRVVAGLLALQSCRLDAK